MHTDAYACESTRALLCATSKGGGGGEGGGLGGSAGIDPSSASSSAGASAGGASRCVVAGPHIECAPPSALSLPPALAEASGQRAWLQAEGSLPDFDLPRGNGAHAKLLQRCRLRLVELLLDEGVDVVAMEPTVLVLSPRFWSEVAGGGTGDANALSVPSDTRHPLAPRDWAHCPLSAPEYSRLADDWLDASLFHARAGAGAGAFVRIAQGLMDRFALTDTDVFQAMLTGHAQVADPMRASREGALMEGALMEGAQRKKKKLSIRVGKVRAKQVWAKPIWLEGEHEDDNVDPIVTQRGVRPLNAPLVPKVWQGLQAEQLESGFSWRRLPRERFANGPAMVAQWENLTRAGLTAVQVGCNTESWIVNAPKGAFLLSGMEPLRGP